VARNERVDLLLALLGDEKEILGNVARTWSAFWWPTSA